MYRRILATLDDSETSRLALEQAIRLARTTDATLGLVHGIDEITTNADKRADMDRFVDRQREAGSWPTRMIVLGTHGRHGLDRLMLGSVAEAILHQATVPVLLVRSTAVDGD